MAGCCQQFLNTKNLLTMPINVLPFCLKQTFPPIIGIFTEGEGDEIEFRLPFKVFSTLLHRYLLFASFFECLVKTLSRTQTRHSKSKVSIFLQWLSKKNSIAFFLSLNMMSNFAYQQFCTYWLRFSAYKFWFVYNFQKVIIFHWNHLKLFHSTLSKLGLFFSSKWNYFRTSWPSYAAQSGTFVTEKKWSRN